ncbi:ISAs1 family transposase [Azotobacter chroococcum]|uniref:ISAs1 family transposase n=1 Tax=Azotobacter chroococcum TaxID=353 RepID=UPI000585AF72
MMSATSCLEAVEKRFEQQSPTSPIALDGKTLRGSCQNGSAVHLMSSFATQARRMLVQQGCPTRPTKSPALLELIKQVDPRGAVVSIDAIGCQKGRPWPHRSSRPRHDYVLTLKDNHSTLHEEVALWLDEQDCQRVLCWPWKRSTRTMAPRGALLQPEPRSWGLTGATGPTGRADGSGASGVDSPPGRPETRECCYFLNSIGDLEWFVDMVRDQ